MTRVAIACLSLVSLLLALALGSSDPVLPGSGPGATRPPAWLARAAPGAAPVLDAEPIESGKRRPIRAPDPEPPGPGSSPAARSTAPVRVRGFVLRGGRPVPDYDLEFQPVGSGTGDEDWDFTDGDGRYEVRLPAAGYDVLGGDPGERIAAVVVLEGARELVVDIHLPVGR